MCDLIIPHETPSFAIPFSRKPDPSTQPKRQKPEDPSNHSVFILNNLEIIFVSEYGESGMWLGLIPVRDRGDIITQLKIATFRSPT